MKHDDCRSLREALRATARTLFPAFFACAWLAACAGAAPSVAVQNDGGAALDDAGLGGEDGGATSVDGGPAPVDGGPAPVDGGPRDAGIVADAGRADAGRDDRTWPTPNFTVRAPSNLQEPALGVNAYFSPTEDTRGVVLKELDAVRAKLHVAMFSIGDATVARRLMTLHQAGVEVHVLWDKTQSESGASDDNYRVLEDAGVRLTKIGFDGGAAFASMHDKFAVLDDARVMTGSHNWSVTGFTQNFEHLLTLAGAGYATIYEQAWQSIAAQRSATNPYVPDAGVNIQFGPSDRIYDVVLRRIQQARRSVYVAMFDLSHAPLIEALVAARARGVRVVMVIDRSQANDTRLDEVLECGGRYVDGGAVCADGGLTSPVIRANAGGGSIFVKMHQKYSVYDEEVVIAGSYNWTSLASFWNHENVVELRSRRLAQRFLGNFLELLRQFDPAYTNPAAPPTRYGFTPGNVSVTFEVKEPRLRGGDTLYFALDPQTQGTGGARAMTRRADGFWEVAVTLPAGATVEYKFLIKDGFGQLHWEGGAKHFYTPVFDVPEQRWSHEFRVPPEGP